MSTYSPTLDNEFDPPSASAAAAPSTRSVENAFLAGNPAAVGLPAFIVGSAALGLVLVGYVPAAALGASIPVIAAATGLGLTIATIWAAATGQSAVASIFGIFAGVGVYLYLGISSLVTGGNGLPLGRPVIGS